MNMHIVRSANGAVAVATAVKSTSAPANTQSVTTRCTQMPHRQGSESKTAGTPTKVLHSLQRACGCFGFGLRLGSGCRLCHRDTTWQGHAHHALSKPPRLRLQSRRTRLRQRREAGCDNKMYPMHWHEPVRESKAVAPASTYGLWRFPPFLLFPPPHGRWPPLGLPSSGIRTHAACIDGFIHSVRVRTEGGKVAVATAVATAA
jgi:hypothetical protein